MEKPKQKLHFVGIQGASLRGHAAPNVVSGIHLKCVKLLHKHDYTAVQLYVVYGTTQSRTPIIIDLSDTPPVTRHTRNDHVARGCASKRKTKHHNNWSHDRCLALTGCSCQSHVVWHSPHYHKCTWKCTGHSAILWSSENFLKISVQNSLKLEILRET